jgi:nucleoside-diphosphate-sugar epimerase
MNASIIILGSGYAGTYLAGSLSASSRSFFSTSRNPEKNLAHLPSHQRIRFDLLQPDTWKNIPKDSDLIWCFPAEPLKLVHQFAASAKVSPRRMVVLGSTSAYDIAESQEYPPPWLDETAPIDLGKPRVQGEEYLRKNCGAIVLRVAGIYGPGRNPLNWIKNGRVGPSRKYMNLIHVEDLAAACLTALERGQPGEVYNVSDGIPRTWEDICRLAQKHGITPSASPADRGTGKRIANGKMTSQLIVSCRHELGAALDELPI